MFVISAVTLVAICPVFIASFVSRATDEEDDRKKAEQKLPLQLVVTRLPLAEEEQPEQGATGNDQGRTTRE